MKYNDTICSWRSKLHRIEGLSIALLLVVTMLIGASSAQTTSSVNINSYGSIRFLLPLHVEGQWIVDSNGNRVILRGAGGDYCAYGRINTWLPAYINWLEKTGCNCIRLGFLVPNPNHLWQDTGESELNLTTMDYVLNLCQQNGIYAILDCHHYWATQSVQGWTDVLPTYEQAWINCWVSIAQRYQNNPTIAIYELANEMSDGAPNATIARRYYYDCINAIRVAGDNHIVMCYDAGTATCGVTTWNNASEILPNMVISMHSWYDFKDSIAGTHGANWFPGNEISFSQEYNVVTQMVASDYVARALQTEALLNCPVVLGEFGTYNDTMSSEGIRYMQQAIAIAEQYGISWNAHQLDDWIQNAPDAATFWPDFCNQELGGAFTSSYISSSIPQTISFNEYTFTGYAALPFNIYTTINITTLQRYADITWSWLNVSINFVALTEDSGGVVFKGPCMLYIQNWGTTRPWSGTLSAYYTLTLGSGQTWTYPGGNFTAIYAWATSPTYVPLPNTP